MKTLITGLILALSSCSLLSAQITRAEDRIARQASNARPSITLDEVKANKITIGDEPFLFQLYVDESGGIEQIEENRWKIRVTGPDGRGFTTAHLPRQGVEAMARLHHGDVVIARIKTDEDLLTLEIIGVSALNVWE